MSLVLLAHAYRLTDPKLVFVRGPGRSERERVAELLEHELPRLEPISAQDVTAESFALVREGAELALLGELAGSLIGIEQGRPVLCSTSMSPVLVALCDPDVLAVARVHQQWRSEIRGTLAHEPTLSWPALLRQRRAGFDDLFAQPMADTHVHLGGALPASLRWLTTITARPSSEQASRLAEGNIELAEAWAGKLAEARSALLRLMGAETREGLRIAGEPDVLLDTLRTFWAIPDEPDESMPLELNASMSLAYLVPERAAMLRGLTDVELHEHLLAYIRIKQAYQRAQVLRPGGRGLARFRARVPRGATTLLRHAQLVGARRDMSAVVESYLGNLGGHANPALAGRPTLNLELRVKIPERDRLGTSIRGWALGAADALRRWHDPAIKLGLIFHLSRSRRDGMSSARAREDHVERFDSLFDRLREEPEVRRLVVGIDAAGDELAAPPRDFIKAFGRMRDRLDEQRDGEPPIRLGFTFHAGEDFRDLLSGIRVVHEASELLGLRAGDRIGHGLALFWRASAFYQPQRPRAAPLLREHLLDLLWAASLLAARGDHEFARFAREQLIERLVALAVQQPTDRVLRLIYTLPHEHAKATEDELLAELIGDVNMPPRARRHDLRIDPTWIEFVDRARLAAIADVRRRGLYIEVNPTSNLLIGGFQRYEDLPYVIEYAVAPDQLPQRIPITLNTDDPGVFQTTLTNEYAQVGNALLSHGLTHGQVWEWLDYVRRTTLRSSFIPADAPTGRALRDFLWKLGMG